VSNQETPDFEDDEPGGPTAGGRPAPEPTIVPIGPTTAAVREERIPPGASFETAILGPTNSGKSYYFQGLMYRLQQKGQQGVLTRYLSDVALWRKTVTLNRVMTLRSEGPDARINYDTGERLALAEFNKAYQDYNRLPQTTRTIFHRYTVGLTYWTGWRGQRKQLLKLSFIDSPGELHRQGPRGTPLAAEVWRAYTTARVVVFCLPIWVAFPGDSAYVNRETRKSTLDDFELIVEHFLGLVRDAPRDVRVVLALTQADAVESGLQTLADRWVRSYVGDSRHHLEQLGGVSGPTQYLAAARSVSRYVAREFSRSTEERVFRIPKLLTVDGRTPWIIPVSAVDGEVVAKRKRAENPPVPAHVDLPLLLALCEAHNALL
jgi:hypothetical protein